jgi:CheY-like chemotaxis protein
VKDLSESRILIVDDIKANVDILVNALRDDYKLSVALDGSAALRSVEKTPPDLVLLDIVMPGMDGHEVCRRIRSTPLTEFLPVVMITASGSEQRLAALESGADDFITKPFDQSELLARVVKLEAEQAVLQNPRHTVVRIVLTAGTSETSDRSFVEDMCHVAKAGKDVTLYADEFRCPLPAGVIARVVWELVDRKQRGLYHLGGSERLSRWEIGETLLPWCPELKGRLIKGSARNHVGSPRPADLSLRYDKIQSLLSFRIPGFREWLAGRSRRGSDLWDYHDGSP